jgi:glycosyltransferase involved in cell wall biosynthesis
MRATFVYANPRRAYAEEVLRGEAPDSQLLGANLLRAHGISVTIHDPLLSRIAVPGPLVRPAWTLREVTLPLELRRTDVVVTGLTALFPLFARGRRFRIVVLNYGLNQMYRRASAARRALIRASLSSTARIVCFGRSQRDELIALGMSGEDNVVTVPLGVDERWFAPASEEPDARPFILTVGKDLGRDFATFGAAVDGIDARVEVIALPRNLVGVTLPANALARHVGITQLRTLYAQASCVVVPQRRETYAFGADGGITVLLEAMAMGRPIVASDRAILRDYVDDGVEALLVPPEDPAALRAAIQRLLDDPELARSLGSAARARVERAYTSRDFAARLAPVLRSVV